MIWIFILGLAAACSLRLPALGLRPMHVDESTQADKFRQITWGEGQDKYHYDPYDHHGPTLILSTVPLAKLTGVKSFGEMTEEKLRLVPALWCLALLLATPLLRDGLGKTACAWAVLFAACSPLMVFYSRYYIMEILLVFFTFSFIACGWRYWVSRKLIWLILCGLSVGLMHATKETFIIHLVAVAGASGGILILKKFRMLPRTAVLAEKPPLPRWHLILGIGCALFISVLLFTKGFTDWQGAVDSVTTYKRYLGERASGEGHAKALDYYFRLLWANHGQNDLMNLPGSHSKIRWTEAGVLVLAALGGLHAFFGRSREGQSKTFQIFLTLYAVAIFCGYSLVAYKTPWCIMTAHHGFILLAGLGMAGLMDLCQQAWYRGALAVLALGLAYHLLWQSWMATRDPRHLASMNNPYAYSYTPVQVLSELKKLDQMQARLPKGQFLKVEVASPGGGWPLRWYLRNFPNVAYLPSVKKTREGYRPVDLTADAILFDPAFSDDLPKEMWGPIGLGGEEYAFYFRCQLNGPYWLSGLLRRSLLDPKNVLPPPSQSKTVP